MSSLAALESELAEAIDNIETCQTALELQPADEEALSLRDHFENEAAQLRARIAKLKAGQSSAPPPPPIGGTPPPPPSDAAPPPPPPFTDEARVIFNTGDVVLAKFSEDKQWYQANIISKTGSSVDPVYTVKFIGYGNKETKRKHEVRVIESKKRKADGPPVTYTPPAPPSPKSVQDGTVISAAPSVDPLLVQKREPSKVSDGPTRMPQVPKKLKGNKALDKAKTNWKDWQKSGPKKPAPGIVRKANKESQFRTSDLPNAKVGFTGSGKPMQKDQARTKWVYDQVVEDPDD